MITIPKTLADYYRTITSNFAFRKEWKKTLDEYVNNATIKKEDHNSGNPLMNAVHVEPYPAMNLGEISAWPKASETHSVFSAGLYEYSYGEWEYDTAYHSGGNELVEAIVYDLFERSPLNGFNLFAVTRGNNDIYKSGFTSMTEDEYLDESGVYVKANDNKPNPKFESDNPILDSLHSILDAYGEHEPEDIRWLVLWAKPIHKPFWFLVHPVLGAEAPRLMYTLTKEEEETANAK